MNGVAGVRQEEENLLALRVDSADKGVAVTNSLSLAEKTSGMKQFKKQLQRMALVLLASFGLASIPARAADSLKAGDAAPDFSLPGSDGKTYKLSDFKGKQAVVLAWFPKAFTGG